MKATKINGLSEQGVAGAGLDDDDVDGGKSNSIHQARQRGKQV